MIRNYSASFKPGFQKGGKMDWERVRPARGVWRPAKHIFAWKWGAGRAAQRPGRSRSTDIAILPFGAAQRAHLTILAQKAEIVQVMVGGFFKTRNPRKH